MFKRVKKERVFFEIDETERLFLKQSGLNGLLDKSHDLAVRKSKNKIFDLDFEDKYSESVIVI